MNRMLLAAAVLSAFSAMLHIFVGTPEIEGPLMASSMRSETSLLLYACWHLVSVTLVFSAAIFFVAVKTRLSLHSQLMVRMISVMWLLFGLVFIIVSLLYSGVPMLMQLPQWTLLTPVGVLGLLGAAKA